MQFARTFVDRSSGWAVDVKMDVPGAGESSQTFYARVSGRHAAEDAVRLHLRTAADLEIEARLPVQSSAFDAMNTQDGQVSQWTLNPRRQDPTKVS
jgi:hypothetical protein